MRDRNNVMLRSDGEVAVLPFNPRNSRRVFADGAELIISAYEERKGNRSHLAEAPNDWFKRNTYRFLRAFIDQELSSTFEAEIRKGERKTDALDKIRENPFKLGIFAMYLDSSFPRNDRQIFGNQMLYAYKHDISPEHLVGFIRAAGSPLKIAEKLKTGFCEPGFPA